MRPRLTANEAGGKPGDVQDVMRRRRVVQVGGAGVGAAVLAPGAVSWRRPVGPRVPAPAACLPPAGRARGGGEAEGCRGRLEGKDRSREEPPAPLPLTSVRAAPDASSDAALALLREHLGTEGLRSDSAFSVLRRSGTQPRPSERCLRLQGTRTVVSLCLHTGFLA